MINAAIHLPVLHCTEQFDEHGYSEPYLWVAYFWADTTTIRAQPKVSVFVPSISDTRAVYRDNIDNDSDITIPNEVGRFQVNLEGGATNLAMLGVLAVLFEEDDTAADAIAAGYDAFPIAVSRELNEYVDAHLVDLVSRVPTDDEIKNIASAIYDSVYAAIADKVGWVSGVWDNQDDYIGYSYALFVGNQLAAPTHSIRFILPPIDADVFAQVSPLGEPVKVGHNHYEIRAELDVTPLPMVCGDEVNAFDVAVGTFKRLRDQRNKLKVRLAQAPEKEQGSIEGDCRPKRQ